jgi:hypothetical protein
MELPGRRSRLVLPFLTVLLVSLTLWLSQLDTKLRNDTAPTGIVAFELAGNGKRAAEILDSWDPRAREAAMLLQGIDYLYLFVYPAWFFLLCRKLAASLAGSWQRVGEGVAAGALLCTPLDAIENYALILQLHDGASDSLARVAWFAAVPKFGFFFVAVIFILAGAGVLLARRVSSRES